MSDRDELYTLQTEQRDFGAPVMLHNLTGFLDAGAAGRLAVDQLLDTLDHRPLATFDIDTLFDYRARRPRMTFVSDHYEQVELPELVLSELHDDAGRPFLLLHGPEPDFAWQRFIGAVSRLVEHYSVSLTVGMHAVPWPAPHTRPVGITAHANNPVLVADRTSWVGALEVPAHVAGLMELSFGERGHQAMGFAAHVPHYLAATEYPRAALALLEAVASSTGLVFPLDRLREAADRTDAEVVAHVAASVDNTEAVSALEMQYDAFVSQQGMSTSESTLPSGEQIAAQVERYLAQMDREHRDDPGS